MFFSLLRIVVDYTFWCNPGLVTEDGFLSLLRIIVDYSFWCNPGPVTEDG